MKLILIAFSLIVIIATYSIFNFQHKSSSDSYPKEPVTSTPASLTLDLQSPDDDLLVFDAALVINGKTLPSLNVLVSSGNQNQVIVSRADGTFSSDFDLKLGVNEITVAVFDSSGDQRTQQRTVYYGKEKI